MPDDTSMFRFPPVPQPDFIIKVKEAAKANGYVVELPYGPVYYFEQMKECIDFVAGVLSRYPE